MRGFQGRHAWRKSGPDARATDQEREAARRSIRDRVQEMERISNSVWKTWFQLYRAPTTTDPTDRYATLVISESAELREIGTQLDCAVFMARQWLQMTAKPASKTQELRNG